MERQHVYMGEKLGEGSKALGLEKVKVGDVLRGATGTEGNLSMA